MESFLYFLLTLAIGGAGGWLGKKLQEINLKSNRSSGSISAVPTRAQLLLKKLPPADCFSFVS